MDTIAVLDFGGQYAHLIANRIRRLGVYSEILEAETPTEKLKKYKGIILSGGPDSVYDKGSVKCDPKIVELGVPLLGICYGHQILAYIQGATVEPADLREYGLTEMKISEKGDIFEGLADTEVVWMSHGDSVKNLPKGYKVIGESPGEHAAIANFEKHFYGFQFHLEVTHTKNGMKILDNFLKICGVKREWSIENFIEEEISTIQKKVNKEFAPKTRSHLEGGSASGRVDKKVFMLVSGGVDSTVAFVLLNKALGEDRVYGLFVDTGFLRLNEREEVESSLREAGFANLHVHDASAEFFEALKEVYEPEKKRQIIGDTFLKVQADVAQKLNLNPEEWILGQGTIYPDTIESGGTKHAAKIKTHHNRVPQIEEMIKQGKIIEPLAQLYKDEVRELGLKLGLNEKLIWRHPFPGPGLAVRCLCAKEADYPPEYEDLQEKIDKKVMNLALKSLILPLQSVGVQGDFRTYRHPLVLNGEADFSQLDKLATTLINQEKEINRVLLLLSPQKIEKVSIKAGYLTPHRINLLQQADAIVRQFIEKYDLTQKIWQFPTVLLPLSVNSQEGESIVLRPVESQEAMTANFYHMDRELLKRLVSELEQIQGITAVFYDVTNKPPGTIEWE